MRTLSEERKDESPKPGLWKRGNPFAKSAPPPAAPVASGPPTTSATPPSGFRPSSGAGDAPAGRAGSPLMGHSGRSPLGESPWARRTRETGEKTIFDKDVSDAAAEEALTHPIEEIAAEVDARSPAKLMFADCTPTIDGAIIRLNVIVLNRGEKPALELKVKCQTGPMLRPVTSPMVSCGDVAGKEKSTMVFSWDMGTKFVDEYANFSLMAESMTSKSTASTYTVKTGRHPLSASERMAAKDEASAKASGKAPPKDKDKGKKH